MKSAIPSEQASHNSQTQINLFGVPSEQASHNSQTQINLFGEGMNSVVGPILKWPGGKDAELKHIVPAMPKSFDRLIEPFVGGGAVFFALADRPAIINDRSFDLINFYECVSARNSVFLNLLESLDKAWLEIEKIMTLESQSAVSARRNDFDFESFASSILTKHAEGWLRCASALNSNLVSNKDFRAEVASSVVAKLKRMSKLETIKGHLSVEDFWSNVEGALKAALYFSVRRSYNLLSARGEVSSPERAAYFFFLREYCYASMFRFNSSGEFNVPFGGISYNRKRMLRKLDIMRSTALCQRFETARLFNLDFEEFFDKITLKSSDFVFFDPPYDTEFSAYDGSEFGKADQRRLRDLVEKIGRSCNLMLVVKATPLIRELYGEGPLKIRFFDKTYMWTVKERNDRKAEHMLITNY